MTITFTVADEAELRAAIFEVSNDYAIDGSVADDYVIEIAGPITLTQSLPMIRGDGIHTITFEGNGNTIDADNAGRVFFAESGLVTIADVTIANAMAQGGNGGDASSDGDGGGGGGGLGAGAAMFVNDGAVVTLSGVDIADAAAAGGDGGSGGPGRPPGYLGAGAGGGGLGGDGGNAGAGGGGGTGGGGGGGYEGTGGDGNDGSGGGGGEFGNGGGL
ncbi:MAG: hypothetical protein ABJ060_20135, partial [Bauldia litoralis]